MGDRLVAGHGDGAAERAGAVAGEWSLVVVAQKSSSRAVRDEAGEVVVTPPERLAEPDDVIDCGNSGTSLRLLAGVLAGLPGLSVLTGDASLRRRPVRRQPVRRRLRPPRRAAPPAAA